MAHCSHNKLIITVFLPLFALFPCMAAAAIVETGSITKVSPPGSTLYNTTGVQIGNELWIYSHGGDPSGDQELVYEECLNYGGDGVVAYKAPIVNGEAGDFVRVGRIVPVVNAPETDPRWLESTDGECTHAPASYGPGQVFEATIDGVKKYIMIADASDVYIFKNVWWGESTDGISWHWHISGGDNVSGSRTWNRSDNGEEYTLSWEVESDPLITTNLDNFFLLNAVMLSDNPDVNNADWWGFLNFFPPNAGSGKSVAAKITWSNGEPQLLLASPGRTEWEYSPVPNNVISSVPNVSVTNILAKTLYPRFDGSYHLWGHGLYGTCGVDVMCNTENLETCSPGEGATCETADKSSLADGEVARPFWTMVFPTGDVATCVDPVTGKDYGHFERSGIVYHTVTQRGWHREAQLDSNVRTMPSGYSTARNYPFVWQSTNGRSYLFSGTNDDNVCTKFLFSPFWLMYTAQTDLVLEKEKAYYFSDGFESGNFGNWQ